MIKLNHPYTILFTSTVAGVGTAADSTPTAVLWRNGSASGVSVTVSTTAQTGLYKAVFTTDSGWSVDDLLELYGVATIAGTAGYLAKLWSSTEIGAAVLDSDARVKLHATQPDYVPATAAALATNYALLQMTDTDVAAIEARLPSDPADQSAVEAAITAATSPLATSSALSTAAGNITTILGKFTGITLLARWLGILGGKTADSTTLTEFNATTGGTSYNNTTDSQEAIRDRGDAAWITGSGGGGGGSGDATLVKQEEILAQLDVIQAKTDTIGSVGAITSLLAAAVLEPGTITSFPETLTIGDSYTEQNGREIQIPIVDTDGTPLSSTGSLNFADASVTFTLQRSGETDSTRVITGSATFVDPPGTGTGAGAPYAVIELPASETAKGLKKYKYSGILTFTWAYSGTGTADDVMSFETDTVTFDN